MSNLNGSLDGIIEQLQRLHWAAEQHVSEAQASLDQAKADRDHLARLLKTAGAEVEAVKPKPKEKGPTRVNPETRKTVLDAIHAYIASGQRILDQVPHSFTVSTLHPFASSVHEGSVRNAIHMLREEGILRAVGLVPDAKRQPPMAYVLGEGNEASE